MDLAVIKKESESDMQDRTQGKTGGAKIAFWLVLALYAGVSLIDAAPMWFIAFQNGGFLNTLFHSIVTLGAGPSDMTLRIEAVPSEIGNAFPAVLFCVLPAAALALGWKKRNALSVFFAVLNLAAALIMMVCGTFRNVTNGIVWILYALAAAAVLVYSLGGARVKKACGYLFLALAVLSAVCFAASLYIEFTLFGDTMRRSVPRAYLNALLSGGCWKFYCQRGVCLGAFMHPFSSALLLLAFSLAAFGARKPETVSQVQYYRPSSETVYAAPGGTADPVTTDTLKMLSQLHDEGVLTDEEFNEKLKELITKIS